MLSCHAHVADLSLVPRRLTPVFTTMLPLRLPHLCVAAVGWVSYLRTAGSGWSCDEGETDLIRQQ